MKIALYQPWLYLHGGLERTIYELVSRSRHNWTIFTNYYDRNGTFPQFKDMEIRMLKPISIKRTIPAVLRTSLTILSQKISLDNFDAFVVWSDGIGDLATIRNHTLPSFVICSTPLRAVFDPVYEKKALAMRNIYGKIAYKIFKKIFKSVDQVAWSYFNGVIATSKEVKKRIISGGLYKDGPKMTLFYPGIDWNKYSENVNYEQFLLVPGRIMWTKNIELAIDAFKKANLPLPWKLIISGFLDEKSQSYFKSLKSRAGKDARIEFIISPSDYQMKDLYNRASVILFPPLNEDWGIAPLEAMASSKPVIANARGGPLESIIHQKTGWLLEPSVNNWAELLKKIPDMKNIIIEMGKKARKHVLKYDWSNFVSGIDNTLEQWIHFIK